MANLSPNYTAYRVIKREGQDDFWLAIGAAWLHEDGEGMNILLQALPLPDRDGQCKIVLRLPKASESDAEAAEAQRATREHNNRRRGARGDK